MIRNSSNLSPGLLLGIAANAISIIIGLYTLWTFINKHIEKTTIEQTNIIASIMSNDLRTRLNLYETYVIELEQKNEKVPILIRYNINALEDQLEDLKKWNTTND